MRIRLISILIFYFLFVGCKNELNENNPKTKNEFKHIQSIKLVKNLASKDYTLVYKDHKVPGIRTIKSCVVISSNVHGYIKALGAEDKIKGVTNPQYIYNKKVLSLINKSIIKSIGAENNLNMEEIIKLNPDIIITSSNPILEKSLKPLKKLGYKTIYIDEYKEQNPLARTEYIKLFGILFNKKAKADSIFNTIEANYNQLKNKAKQINHRPTVLLGIMYGDTWFMPAGNSYITTILKDAKAHYLWENEKENLLLLSFEEVYNKAKNADYWINISDIKNKSDLKRAYTKYNWFKSYQTNQLYTYNKQMNKQVNNFYEEGVIRCDLILQDLLKIFHPQLFSDNNLYFYQKIE